jgi:hypothetical protein
MLLMMPGVVLSADGLQLPPTETGSPAPGHRVSVVTPEYAGTDVHHTLYLPPDWTAEWKTTKRTWPVIVELTGNLSPGAGSTGRVDDAGLGFGISQGKFIWIVLPYIAVDHKQNQLTWWGDVSATVEYAKKNIPQSCETYGGNPDQVLLCGFSRGAIGVNFIGLHDNEIAKLWCGLISHDHYDGVLEWKGTDWGSPLEKYQREALTRLKRLGSKPALIMQAPSTKLTRDYLQSRYSLEHITFIDVDMKPIFPTFPNDYAINPHNDRWLLVPGEQQNQVHVWLDAVLKATAQNK